MKQVLLTVLAFTVLSFGIRAQAQTTQAKQKKDGAKQTAAVQPVAYPYTATYSAQFEMGKPALAQMILNMYKEYENNIFSGESPFADTVTAILPDGRVVNGDDQVSSLFEQERAGQQSIRFSISAVIPVRSTDRNEDWVLVWGADTSSANGNSATNEFHHAWRINKDGKIDHLQFFQRRGTEGM